MFPAEPNTGILMQKVNKGQVVKFHLSVKNVYVNSSRVVLKKGEERLSFIEHLLAAVYGMGIDNVRIEVEGDELPFFDGSSSAYVEAIKNAGIEEQGVARQKLSLKRSLMLIARGRIFYLSPAPRLGISYVFFHKGLRLKRFMDIEAIFADSIAPARTFAAGPFPSFEYPFGVRQSKKLSFPYPSRFSDEMLRHKVLDMIGDLALLGKRLAAHIWAFGTGHRHTHEAVKLLLRET